MIHYKDNLIKQDNCWISLKELLKNIIEYNNDIRVNHKNLNEEYNNVKETAIKLLGRF